MKVLGRRREKRWRGFRMLIFGFFLIDGGELDMERWKERDWGVTGMRTDGEDGTNDNVCETGGSPSFISVMSMSSMDA